MQFHMNFMINFLKNVCEKPYWDINSYYFWFYSCPGYFCHVKNIGTSSPWFEVVFNFLGSLTSFTYTTLCSFWHVKFKALQFVCIHVYTWMCMCGCGARYLQQCLMNTSKMYYHGALFPILLLSTSLCSVSV